MSEKKTYCGIGPVPKNQKRGSMLECAKKKQVRFYGLHTVDKKTLQKALLNTTTKAHLNRLKTKATPKPTTSSSKKATTAKKGAPNRWMEHVNAFKKLNADMPHKLALQEAKKTYKKAPKSTKKSSPALKWLYDAKLDRGPVLPWLDDPVDDDAALKSLYVPRTSGPGAPRGLPKLKKTDILESIPWLADPGKDPKKTARKAAPAAPKKPAAKSTKKAAPAAPKGPKKIDPAFKRRLAGWITAGKAARKTAAKSTKKAAPVAPKTFRWTPGAFTQPIPPGPNAPYRFIPGAIPGAFTQPIPPGPNAPYRFIIN
jgi:hypothetical protein